MSTSRHPSLMVEGYGVVLEGSSVLMQGVRRAALAHHSGLRPFSLDQSDVLQYLLLVAIKPYARQRTIFSMQYSVTFRDACQY